MIIISHDAIDKSCKLIRSYFPQALILEVFRDVTASPDLATFPNLKEFADKLASTPKIHIRISIEAMAEASTYFAEDQTHFLLFLKTIIAESLKSLIINKVSLDEFVSKINIILTKDSRLRIENYKVIQKMIPNRAKRSIFVSIDVPEYIQDYFSEGIDCFHYGLHRSSILFFTFALEASLRYRYSKLETDGKAYSLTFDKLIDWGIKKGLIEQNKFNEINITFIRQYRNDLVHFNMDKPDAELKISKSNAEKMSPIILELVKLFIDSIFYY